jgi:hypothetical protein
VNRKQQTNNTQTADAGRAASLSQSSSDGDHRRPRGTLRSKLPFFRMMLWVLVYVSSALFLISLLLLQLMLQTKIIGGALLAVTALLLVTYVLQWRE